MISFEPMLVGLGQLRAHRLRSLLTLLGIVIGVAVVIAVVALGEGLKRTVLGEFASSGGAGAIQVQPPQQWERKGGRWVQRPWQEYLTTADLEALREETNDVRAFVPTITGSAQLQYQKTTLSTSYKGTSAAFDKDLDWPLVMGRTLSAEDLRYARRVCVLGHKIYEDLFHGAPPLGQEIKFNGERYLVIGVLEKRVRFGRDEGNLVFIPYSTAQQRMTGTDRLAEISLFAERFEAVDEIVEAIRRVLRRRHEHGDEFKVETSRQQMESANKVIGGMQQVAGGIAAVSLLVGGIGIMNILLVSVTERTREIGIRKALGAKRRHILGQFLAESIALSLIGGLLGIAVGFGLGLGVAALIQSLAPGSPFASVVSLQSILWAVGFAAGIGIFFGVYPAARAARLDPVEALRYE
jgi:putative ABC transport system permease protein